ncbi:mitochondrial 37S ribosomal protein bS21m NDAI_0A01460 [Naumovozyma dairenensis CBS 421]|uniref:Ribosomal protein S21 n=1 Tax=Naumovozyma dairenensis (strain ATCC 10597 / BCRC 20456 / CBS 421 / NBRC 0211 / NRRL Y-12639) TaxID=1071378 RepID=G0W3B6_NAUDC|nr:hypothetical protein NDAI_0A01460 [Naumovozyma dairenensis CBS 421]CCD22304.1 hypothetical protein NDAI_0A01460 [Naumovozyma dairenensis CBS 421]
MSKLNTLLPLRIITKRSISENIVLSNKGNNNNNSSFPTPDELNPLSHLNLNLNFDKKGNGNDNNNNSNGILPTPAFARSNMNSPPPPPPSALRQVDVPNLMRLNPREAAMGSKLIDTYAGRVIDVRNGNTIAGMRSLNSLIFSNEINKDRRKQQFYMKPGKAAELKKSLRHRKVFMLAFKRMMDVVKDAKRKGY